MTLHPSWDYYEATLTGVFDPAPVLQNLGLADTATQGSAHRNYPASYVCELPSGGSIQIWYGAQLEVHVVLTSAACDDLVPVLRRLWPHRVSRADVALDYDYPHAFDRIHRALHALAREFKPRPVQTSVAGDWLDGEAGRTLYLGARSSRLLVRVYEKGHEQAAAHPDQGPFSLDWTRVEWQVRPDSRHKGIASSLPPAELASSTRFGGEVLAHLAGASQPALPLQRVPSTDPLYWLVQQYGRVLREAIEADPALTVAALLDRAGSRVGAADRVATP